VVSRTHLDAGPTVAMIGHGRSVRARRDRDRAGSGGKRPTDPEAKDEVPVDGGEPVAVGGVGQRKPPELGGVAGFPVGTLGFSAVIARAFRRISVLPAENGPTAQSATSPQFGRRGLSA
jgi:hypothetical protein